jgi:hypothetical protein
LLFPVLLQTLNKLYRFFGAVALFCLLTAHPSPAVASMHPYPEAADQITWRSLQTLRDRSGQAWQVIFFKRMQAGQVTDLHLRLVGFPGQIELSQTQPLSIAAGTELWLANLAAPAPDLPSNAKEYDWRSIMSRITADIPLELTIPATPKRNIHLPVPPFVVKEWRQVAAFELPSKSMHE